MSIAWFPASTLYDTALSAFQTQYSYVLDHLYAVNGKTGEMGSNIARRPHWPIGDYIYADECNEYEIVPQGEYASLSHSVFFDDGRMYDIPAADEHATDWQIATTI